MGKIIERGDYVNGSDWIRVEMPKESIAPTQCMPYGHAYQSVQLVELDLPTLNTNHSSQYSRVPKRYFCGTIFNEDSPDGFSKFQSGVKIHLLSYFLQFPENAGCAGDGFYMDEPGKLIKIMTELLKKLLKQFQLVQSASADEFDARGFRRFLVGFQGGEDGHSPVLPIMLGTDIRNDNVQGMDCSKRFSSGTQGYERAFKALSNQDEFDINLLVTPAFH